MVNHRDDDLDAVFAALAHPTRRVILERLARGGATVGEIAEPFDLSLPAVSRHLLVLERAGLLQRRVAGRIHRLALAPRPLRQAVDWLEQQRRFWEPRLDALVAYLETTNTKGGSPWSPETSAPTSRSASSAASAPRGRRSSKRGRTRKR